MNVLLGVIGIPLALVLPGLSTVAALAPQRRLDWLERAYLALAISLALGGWLGLLLAQIGWFSTGLLLALLSLHTAVMGWLAWRRDRWRWCPPERPREARWVLVAFLATSVLFVALAFRPFELILGPRDAATYPATAAQIARHGGIVIHDPLIPTLAETEPEYPERIWSQFFAPQHEGRFYYTFARMPAFFIADMEQGTVVPQFYHLYPTWLAIAFSFLGIKAGLLMTPYLSLLGAIGAFLVARRLFGSRVALMAYLFLILNTLQVWFARYSTSEGATQFLVFLAIFSLLCLEEHKEFFFGLLAGFAFGLIGLVRVDFFFPWLLLLPYLAYLFVTHRFRRAHRGFLFSFGVLAVHSLVQVTTLTWAYTLNSYYHRIQDWYSLSWLVYPLLTPILQEYFRGRTPILQQPWRLAYELGIPSLLLGLAVFLRRSPRLLARIRDAWRAHQRLLLNLAAGLFLVALLYTYLLWPGLLKGEVLRHPLENRAVLEGYIGAPVPEGRAANMVRLGWYFSPLGIALALAGIVGMIRRTAQRSWFLLSLGLLYLTILTYEVFGEAHHVYIMRRYVPEVVPLLSIAMAYAVDQLARTAWLGKAGRALAGGLAALMVVYLAYTGLPFYRHNEYRGALDQIGALAEHFDPDDVILLINDDRDTPYAVGTPLQYLFDRQALGIRSSPPRAELIEAQIRYWQQQGRDVYLMVGNDGGRLFLPQTRLTWLGRFELTVSEFEQLTQQKPHNSYVLRLAYGLYSMEPWAGPGSPLGTLPLTIDLGSDGYAFQASGFHQDEVAPDGSSFCWTNGEGVLRLPWPEGEETVTITLRLAGGKRPQELGPAQVGLCFGETCLASWTLEEAFSVQSLSLPAGSVPPAEGSTVLLSLVSTSWKQADYGLGGDQRPLGVQVDWVRVETSQP